MSLARLALRVATVRALTGVTLAGARVYDSAVDPIGMQDREGRLPVLVVYTDDHARLTEGKDLRTGEDTCDLVIEIFIAASVTASTGEEDVVVQDTDGGKEVLLDILSAQVANVLMGAQTEWAGLWRDFVLRVTRTISRRGASAENGIRFAARQIVISCDILADPVPGRPAPTSGPWARLLSAMGADAETAGLRDLILYHMTGSGTLSEGALLASLLGLADGTEGALGVAEEALSVAGEPIPAETIIVDADAPDGPWTITGGE